MARGITQIIASFIPVTLAVFFLMQCQDPYRTAFTPPADDAEIKAAFPRQIGSVSASIISPARGYFRADYGTGGTIRVRRYRTASEANDALFTYRMRKSGSTTERVRSIRSEIITESELFSYSVGQQSAYTTADGRTGFYWINGSVVFSVEGRSKAIVDAIARAYPYIEPLAENEKTAATKLFERAPPVPILIAALAFILCAILFVAGIFSIGEHVMIRRPAAGTPPVSMDELTRRLREHSVAGPLEVITGKKNGLVLRWNFLSARWFSPAEIAGEHKVWEMHLAFDEAKHAVFVSDEKRTARIALGADGALTAAFSGSFSLFKGIINESEKSIGIGVDARDADKRGILEYGFSTGIVKRPVREIVLAAGWSWEPRVFLP